MANSSLRYTGTNSVTGWTNVGNVTTDDGLEASSTSAGVFVIAINNSPADFLSQTSVQLHIRARRHASSTRSHNLLVELLNGAGTVLQSFTTPALTTTETLYSSTAFSRSDNAATIDGYQIRVTDQEGGGMPGTEVTFVDEVYAELVYTPSIAVPTNLTLTEQAGPQVLVDWDATEGTEFGVQRETDAVGLTTVAQIPKPGSSTPPVGDLAWDGTDLWHADRANNTIYRFDPADGSVLQSFATPGLSPYGLTWDGTNLWHTDEGSNTIYRLDPADGSILQSFASPGADPKGLAWDGTDLWHADSGTDTIYRLDPADGSILQSFASPGSFPVGLTWDGTNLCNADDSTIYKIDPADGSILTAFDDAPNFLAGLTWDGTHFWLTINSSTFASRWSIDWGDTTDFTGIAATQYTDTTPVAGTKYRYRVRVTSPSVSGYTSWSEITLEAVVTPDVSASDTVELGDSLEAGLETALVDGVSLTDAEELTQLLTDAVVDGIEVFDNSEAVLGMVDSVSDGVESSDSVSALQGADESLEDGAKLAEELETYLAVDQDPEGISLGDVVSYATAIPSSVADGTNLGDSLEESLTTFSALSDGPELGEDLTVQVASEKGTVDGIDLGEVVAETLLAKQGTDDGLSLGEAVEEKVSGQQGVADGVALGESLDHKVGISDRVDGLDLGENLTARVDVGGQIEDAVALSDAPEYAGNSLGQGVDGVEFGETLDSKLHAKNSSSEGLVLGDTAQLPLPPSDGKAIHFDEVNQYATIPDSAALRLEIFTLSMWVKFDDHTGSGQQFFFSWGPYGSTSSINLHHGEDGSGTPNLTVRMRDAAGGNINVSLSRLTPGEWHHLAIVGNGTNVAGSVKIWVNGVVEYSHLGGWPWWIDVGAPLYLGVREDLDASTHFGGAMADLANWGVVLSDQEILDLANAGSGVRARDIPTSRDYLYEFDESGTESSGGDTATLFNSPTWVDSPFFTGQVDNSESLIEGALLGEAVEGQANVQDNLFDTAVVGDENDVRYDLTDALTDGSALGESVFYSGSVLDFTQDGISVGDALATQLDLQDVLTDGSVFSENVSPTTGRKDSITDGAALVDAAASRIDASQGLSDGLHVGDEGEYAGASSPQSEDGIHAGDNLTVRWDSANDLTEGTTLSDQAVSSGVGDKAAADGLLASDTLESRVEYAPEDLSDTLELSEALQGASQRPVDAQEGVDVGDTAQPEAGYVGELSEGIHVSDEIAYLLRILTDEGVIFGEEIDMKLVASFLEGLSLSDGTQRGVSVGVGDGIALSDKPGRGDNREVADGVRMGDTQTSPARYTWSVLEAGIYGDILDSTTIPGRDPADILDLTVYLMRQAEKTVGISREVSKDTEIKRSKSFDIEL